MLARQEFSEEQVSRVQRRLNRLPSRKLFKLAKTTDLERQWIRFADNAQLMGKVFTMRFARQGDDPISFLLETPSGKLQYEILWERAEAWDRLYVMLQVAGSPLRKALTDCGYHFDSVFSLFLAILSERYDHAFLKHVQGFKSPAKKLEPFLRDSRDCHRKRATPEAVERTKSFIRDQLGRMDLELNSLVMAVIEEERKNNPVLNNRKREYEQKTAHVSDLISKQVGNRRRAGTLKSVQWRNGVHYVGVRGGRYIAEPLQTFPPVP